MLKSVHNTLITSFKVAKYNDVKECQSINLAFFLFIYFSKLKLSFVRLLSEMGNLTVNKFKVLLILIAGFTAACSQADNSNKLAEQEVENDLNNARKASLYAQFNQLYYTKFVFSAAYEEATQVSKTNDQLLNFASYQAHAIKTIYDTLGINLSRDLKALSEGKNSAMTLNALDALCVGNKFIGKYSALKVKSGSKISPDVKDLSDKALALQPEIEKILKNSANPMGDIQCLKLK